MVRFSNNLIAVLNILTLLLSIPIICAGIWLSNRYSTDCERFLERPVILLGVFLLLVSIAGIIGACCKNSLLLWLYLFIMFILIVLLLAFTIFAFFVTNKGAGEAVSNRGYREYRVADYSHWLQDRVGDGENWAKIRSCLVEGGVCQRLEEKNLSFAEFVNDNLSPVQSGCCKPPTHCNFAYVSETNWTKPADYPTDDLDCKTWDNDPSTLCYDCNSCKAGVLANLKNDWKKVAIVNIVFVVILIVVYSIGCCAFRNNREDNSFLKFRTGYA